VVRRAYAQVGTGVGEGVGKAVGDIVGALVGDAVATQLVPEKPLLQVQRQPVVKCALIGLPVHAGQLDGSWAPAPHAFNR
jgi:hypothetical protein